MIATPKEIKIWPVTKLKPYEKNARTHSDEQVAQIMASMQEFGFTNPILVDSKDGIIAGHGRLQAAKKLGLDSVPVIVLDHLTDAQRRAYIIADNKLALNAGWDLATLSSEIDKLSEEGFDLDLLGFSDEELEDLLPEAEEVAPQGEADEVPEVRSDPKVVRGEVYILGKHRLMCGDSTSIDDVERLMNGEKADMVFTDPPYGVSFVGLRGTMYTNGKRVGKNTSIEIENDDLRGEDVASLFRDALSLAVAFAQDKASFYIFFAINRSSETLSGISDCGLEVRNWLIWDKGNVGYHAMNVQYKPNYEAFLYCHKSSHSPEWCGDVNQQTIWRHSVERLGLHPTMKPVALIEQAFRNHEPKLVLDLFGGSGSTLIACEKTARAARLMELDPIYVGVILDRWQKFTGKKAKREDGVLWDEIKGDD